MGSFSVGTMVVRSVMARGHRSENVMNGYFSTPKDESVDVKSRLLPRIIPCLDVRDGRVVKGIKFQGLRDAGDPAELARKYADDGADELVMLDVSATPNGKAACLRTIAAIRDAISIPLTVGGGVREVEDGARFLDAGADKVAVNTAAVSRPELLRELSQRFGKQCVVLAIDAASKETGDGYEVVTHSGKTRTGLCALVWAQQGEMLGAGELLLTSWDRDGTKEGYDTQLLSQIRQSVRLPIVASGGASGAADLREAFVAGADAALAASIFHDGVNGIQDVKEWLLQNGVRVRI